MYVGISPDQQSSATHTAQQLSAPIRTRLHGWDPPGLLSIIMASSRQAWSSDPRSPAASGSRHVGIR
jgi:hypothetical protein